jgi:hypothetical protein
MRWKISRLVALAGASLGWAALAVQLLLSLDVMTAAGGTVLGGVWRYLGYFTVIANLFATITLSLAALGRFAPRREFAAVTAMILVGIVYSLLLRETWNPQGLQKPVDVALHDAMPVLVVLFWLLRPRRGLAARDIWVSVILPLGYAAYAMARGALDGWYPYAFMDVRVLGVAQTALNCLGMGAAFLAMALLLVWLDRVLP